MKTKFSIQSTVKQEFSRYFIVGGVAFIADFCLLALLSGPVGMHYLLASLFSFLFGTWVNYQMSIRWVFRYRSMASAGPEFGIFLLVGVMTLGIGLGLIALMVAGLGWHVLVAKSVSTAITLGLNFGGRKFLLFTRMVRETGITARN
jgi:putative flippase GtrA